MRLDKAIYRAGEIIFGNVNRLRFIQIPSKRLKKDTGTQVYKSTLICIAGKVFGFLVELFVCRVCYGRVSGSVSK